MSITSDKQTISVALIGNPNTGKSTLFNALVGVRQRTGNYPGVTVEKKVGRVDFHDQSFSVVDLPGTYSLAPRSPDEMIEVDVGTCVGNCNKNGGGSGTGCWCDANCEMSNGESVSRRGAVFV